MLKFTCQRCGSRIAIQRKHLGRVVTCPECGGVTHPLAGELDAARKSADGGASPAATAAPVEPGAAPAAEAFGLRCDNCGCTIGKLEKRQLWNNSLVCNGCHEKLSAVLEPAKVERTREEPAREATQATPSRTRVSARRVEPPAEVTESGAPAEGAIVVYSAPPLPAVRHPDEAPYASYGDAPYGHRGYERPGGRMPRMGLNLRSFPTAWPAMKARFLQLLLVMCLLAAAVYGALSLLKDLAGLIATVAFIAVAVVAGIFILRAAIGAGRRLLAAKFGAKAGAGSSTSAEK